MQVFKFGGASVKDAESVRNVGNILTKTGADAKVIVISAMGKNTDALERIVEARATGLGDFKKMLGDFNEFHHAIAKELFDSESHEVFGIIDSICDGLQSFLEASLSRNFKYLYDQTVSIGELLSTRIISEYLNEEGINNTWLDVRDVLYTDNTYQDAKIDWEISEPLIRKRVEDLLESGHVITQGFIGSTTEKLTTTLGREGSDFTAAVFANCMDAEKLVFWKDVPGILNADPKKFNDTVKFDKLTFRDTIEMTYYGSKVLHPKTIKPLQNKKIPLEVRSFKEFDTKGTLITERDGPFEGTAPMIVLKPGQLLLSFLNKDFSFIVEDNISRIFRKLAKEKVRVNMMQNAAVTFSIAIDFDKDKAEAIRKMLEDDFEVRMNDNLEMLTIRHFTKEKFEELTKGREILLRQETRSTIKVLMTAEE